ncbi:MAG: CocE/NonD family hydrolase [Alphaproteobacteria bacterium]|nr:CocE/NonD family hydrolase [Alphaproteobacteria bacterium]
MRLIDMFPRPIREIENAWIPMRDGCRLAARIWLPIDAERDPVPAILEYIPYRKRDAMAYSDSFTHPYFAGHGYASIRVDIRGSGDSDGVLLDEYPLSEQEDALDILAWIADQPWSTGKVGMMGISWGGFNSLQVAARRPPQLKAIITCCSTDDRYADDVHFMGGCILKDGMSWGSGIFSVIPRPPDPLISGPDWKAKWRHRLDNAVVPLATWLRHQRRDAYWKHGSICEDYDAIECAVYAVGGWVDGYSNVILRLLERLKAPCKGLIGPWTHAYPHQGVPGPAIGFLQECLRWWDHWLKGRETGVMSEPRLKVWMQEAIPPDAAMPKGEGRWIAEAGWPAIGIEARRFTLNPGRLETNPEPETWIDLNSPQSTGSVGGEWCPLDSFGDAPEFQSDQREDDGRSLCFDTAPLSERIEILGAPVVGLDLVVDRPQSFICVRLCDVAPDGTSTRVTFGLLNLSHRESHEFPRAMVPGERTPVSLALNDTAYAFLPGHRIRLAISTAYWPMVWPAPLPVTLRLFTGASRLTLPLRAPKASDASLPPFPPPEGSKPLDRTILREPWTSRGMSREFGSDKMVYTHEEDRGVVRLDAIDLVIGYEATERYHISDRDPADARAEFIRRIGLQRGTWRPRVETVTDVSCDAGHFHLRARITAWDGDDRFFDREWNESIPRDNV